MNRLRQFGTVTAAIAVLTAGACGGSQVTAGPGGPTGPRPPKLALAATAQESAPIADTVGGGAALYPARPTKYVLDGAFSDLGATARVRRMKAHTVDAAAVQRFADALGVAGTPTRDGAGWQVQGLDASLRFDIAGGDVSMSYSRGVPGAVGGSTGSGTAVAGSAGSGVIVGPETKPVPPVTPVVPTEPVVLPPPTAPVVLPPPTAPVDVPSAADAETMARALLDRVGVLSGQNWSTEVNDSGGVVSACPAGVPCPTVPPQVSARTVTFTLLLDGTRVDGEQWSVTIGEHRRIEYVNGEWATATDLGEYPLRSASAVFADLQQGKARAATPVPMMAMENGPTAASGPPVLVVHVSGVSLGLARWNAEDAAVGVVDIVPTYRFRAHVDGGEPYDLVLLALDPGAVTFEHPAREPKPKPNPEPTARPLPSPLPAPAPDAPAPPPSP